MAFCGMGTQTSPISLDDSEDEVFCELYKDSNHSSSSSLSVTLENPPLQPWGWSTESQPPQWDRKRKRTQSLTSHNTSTSGPSVPQHNYNTLENRLSQPESKKARKRRRKAERQALEDARLQNINWLNGPSPFASGVPILPPRSWSSDVQLYGSYLPPQSTDHASLLKSGMITGLTPLSSFAILPDPEEFTSYDHFEPPSITPPPPPSRWASSMAKAAASDPIDLTTEEQDEPSQWSPVSIQIPMPLPPPSLPLPLPSHATNIPPNPARLKASTLPKSVEHHALPPKPPPQQPAVQGIIGMKPDQDPNSKHGIFQLSSATKEAGTDGKKGPHYMPNPARTLVMEHLPKPHRHFDYINNWSKSACGARPVHIFIDVPGGKALIEFATAELARKAWASPKLGPTYSHPVRGKPREDMIKVWWYRVNGVGASSGVGEIEEGEIEGDTIEREVEQPTRKETKKEKKARLAKEREEKRVKRELELRLIKERNALQQQQTEVHISSTSVPGRSSQGTPPPPPTPRCSIPLSPRWSPRSPCWSPRSPGPLPLSPGWSPRSPCYSPRSPSWSPTPLEAPSHQAFGPGAIGWTGWKELPVGHVWNQSWVQPSRIITGQEGGLDDHGSDMEIDEPRLPPQASPLHSSLPPRPAPSIAAPLPRVAVRRPPPLPPPPQPTNLASPSSRPVCENPFVPQVGPPPPIIQSSESSLSTTPLPSEPRAMKNAPTEPSFTKRALMARQKELEEKIAKSKLELAETRAAGSVSKPGTPVISVQPANDTIPVKPLMDLGEKQAMEDRLRKLVLQSQRARGKAAPPADNSNGVSNVSPATTSTPVNVPSISPSISVSSSSYSSSSSSVPSPVVPSDQLPSDQLTTVSLSAHNFSLEDLAVSFITQTIETIKSQPAPTQTQTYPSKKPSSTTTQFNNNSTTKLELAAKQKRLEQHIMESKNLMTKLSQAQTKQEKDTILKAMRQMTRSFEEGSQSNVTTTATTTTMKPKTGVPPPPVRKPSPTPQGTFVRIWPGSHEDAGVLILSDSDDNCESDED